MISKESNWEAWIVFFLQAIIAQATANADKVRKIFQLYNIMKDRFREVTHSQYSIDALDAIFSRPIFSTSDFVKSLEKVTTKQTAMLLLRQLQSTDIIKVLKEGSGRRAARLTFPDLLNLVEGREVATDNPETFV
jgi:hypothetical protein